ncbi:NADP-dependent oxidoreductase [Immundisolibacter sp.]|uniref:NADP-dependent oxidoreductase n=1 Tax=Immundisolibacter sp. TaxID=1934948 RepID=UPI002603ECEE|nr:NADP-dependent oxidoreductase [Immundisolibacter sp.]MDD3651822.1 NADP-dependent oxidoreductase [Immundisolibacter sp.]
MRAALLDGYGGAERLRVAEVPDAPPPRRGQVRVRVHAASLNPIDWKVCAGYFRLIPGQRMPMIPGSDCSGVVDAVGDGVAEFKPGDAVFGLISGGVGHTFAQLVTAPAKRFAHKPANVSHHEAASAALVGVTVLEALTRGTRLAAGQRVFVSAGAGGVGSFAVQYARSVGAQVLASAGAANLDFVRGLGAETVFDYATTDCAAQLSDLDVIFDAWGDLDARRYLTCLKPGGVFLTTGSGGRSMEDLATRYGKRWWLFGGLADVLRLRWQARREGRQVAMVFAQPRAEHLQRIARLLESGAVKAQVGQVYALDDIARAFADGQTGHARGKRVIDLGA